MLKEILSISGKPGLYKLISNTANALIVESLLDGKRFPAYSNAKIIALEDISIYTEDEDMPLKTVFKRIFDKEEGKPAINHSSRYHELYRICCSRIRCRPSLRVRYAKNDPMVQFIIGEKSFKLRRAGRRKERRNDRRKITT